MEQLKIIGTQNVAGFSFTGVEGGFGEGKKAMLAKEIAEIHKRTTDEINRAINRNLRRFRYNIEIVDLKDTEFVPQLVSNNIFTQMMVSKANNIYLLSERGYAKLLKILEDDKAWEIYDQLVDNYFGMRQQLDTSQLSPELQMFNSLFNTLAKQEMKQKQLELENKQNKAEIQGIREIVALNVYDWRKDTTNIINKIAVKQGGFERFREVRKQSYDLLERRAGAKLQIRLVNKQKKMALEGAAKSRIDKVSKLDVIEEDKRLLEIYLAVVKEMAIRHNIELPQAN